MFRAANTLNAAPDLGCVLPQETCTGQKRSKAMRVIRPNQTAAKVGLCDRQLRELEAQGLFPKRFLLNPSGNGRAVGHLESEVEEWIAARAASRPSSRTPKSPIVHWQLSNQYSQTACGQGHGIEAQEVTDEIAEYRVNRWSGVSKRGVTRHKGKVSCGSCLKSIERLTRGGQS